MKKIIQVISIIIVMILSNQIIYGQATVIPNTGGGGDYLGWQTGTNLSLIINNNDAYPINFLTGNIQRASILGSGNPGFFGIGSFTPGHKLDVDSAPTT